MTDRATTCSRERLQLMIAGDLPADVEAEAQRHIAGCRSCQQALDSLAGDQDWWGEVRSCFSENANKLETQQLSRAAQEPTLPDDDCGDGDYATDFAVEFLEPCEQPAALGKLDDIEMLEVIGRGGMGMVLKGYQRELGRFVAVKVMAPHLAANGSARKRFAREARAAAAIVHPHVMPIHSVQASVRLPYLVMPLLSCESLQQRLDREGPLDVKEVLRIGNQVAAGLAAAHAQGLVHRDVKPANILLEKGVDRVLLTDFGLARAVDDASLTRTDVIAGTPQFMSPEQARGEFVDTRSDLFSLGSVMYAMCTGRPPFRAETSFGVLRRISDDHPRAICEINPDAPVWLAEIIGRLHAKSAADRFQSALEVAERLESCLSEVQQPAGGPPPLVKKRDEEGAAKRRLKRTGLLAGGIAAVCFATFAVVLAFAFPAILGSAPDTASEQRPKSLTGSPAPSTELRTQELLWDDGVSEQILEIQQGANALETRAQVSWDKSIPQ